MIAMQRHTERNPVIQASGEGAANIRERVREFMQYGFTGRVWVTVHIQDGHLQRFVSGQSATAKSDGDFSQGEFQSRMDEARTTLQNKLMATLCCGFFGTVTLNLSFQGGECKMIWCDDEQSHRSPVR
jgi:hypothetical protein